MKKKPSFCPSEATRSITDHGGFPDLCGFKQLFELENYDDEISEIIGNSSTKENAANGDTNSGQMRKPCISSVDRNDLKRISLIGSGQFCNVYSVTGNLSRPCQRESQDLNFQRKRSLLAFKTIDSRRLRNSDDLVVAAIDLANEAKILSQLDHKNIIQLRGISKERFSESFSSESQSNGEGFFLVIDILKETLGDRLQFWRKSSRHRKFTKKNSKRIPSSLSLSLNHSSIFQCSALKSRSAEDSKRNEMYNRIENIAFGIAEGMEYLHFKQIVLRDLKPTNVGFDFETGNEIRLFDFGMARRVTDCVSDEICGSPRYMAPEVMAGKGYSLKVDVYSFGVLLFEICTLHAPYLDNYWGKKKQVKSRRNSRLSKLKDFELKLNDFYSHVVEDNLRPSDDLNSTVPCSKIRELIYDCWSTDPNDRPTFSAIISRLDDVFKRKQHPI